MEKKTLGSFIALLRKSRGMTQRELAEKLGVSDKTISHWERDESSPDINLIPIIAEIFDVTCDELLKGEKAESTDIMPTENKEKQQKYLFEKVYSKFRTQCLVLTGVALVGFIFAFIAYWEWNWSFFLVDLIFFIISVFGLVIIKLQNKTAILTDESTVELREKYEKKARELFWYSVIINVVLTCFATVQEIDDGLAVILAVVSGILLYTILRFTKQITFNEKGKIIESVIVRTLSVSLALILAFTGLFFGIPELITEINTPDSVHFQNMDELKSFMETANPAPDYASGERGTNTSSSIDFKDGEYVWQCYGDTEEDLLVEFVWRNNEIQHIEFSFYEDGTYSADVMFFEKSVSSLYYDIAEPIFYTFYPVVIVSAVLSCIFKIRKKIK